MSASSVAKQSKNRNNSGNQTIVNIETVEKETAILFLLHSIKELRVKYTALLKKYFRRKQIATRLKFENDKIKLENAELETMLCRVSGHLGEAEVKCKQLEKDSRKLSNKIKKLENDLKEKDLYIEQMQNILTSTVKSIELFVIILTFLQVEITFC